MDGKPRATRPIKLGAVSSVSPIFENGDYSEGENSGRQSRFSGRTLLLMGFFGLVVLIGLLVGVLLGTTDVFGNVGAGGSDEPSSPGSEETTIPTVRGTLSPTKFPTEFPTPSPTNEITPSPTRAPTRNPTNAPQEECITGDEVCGCNKVISSKIDVIFLIDESGSVEPDNYDLMKTAVKNFVAQSDPKFDQEEGARIGYVEFSTGVNAVIDLDEFDTADAFNNRLDEFGFSNGGTNHRLAFLEAARMAREIPLREDSTLAIVMITDGESCIPGCSGCCSNLNFDPTGTDVVRALRQDIPFSLIFLPVQGFSNVDFSFLDGVTGNGGLADEEFIVEKLGNFGELNDLLNGDSELFPQGPCVDAPTFSDSDRALLAEEAMQKDSENILL